MELEDGIRKIGAGESINILPGVVHRLYNETDEDVIAVRSGHRTRGINEQDMLGWAQRAGYGGSSSLLPS